MGSHTCQNNSETEKGALLVTVLVIIAALILIGSLVISIVVTERNISRNHKMAKDAFYLADAGYPITVSIIEAIAQQREEAHEAFSTEPRLKNEVMDYYHDDPALNDRLRDSPEVSPDVRSSLFGQTLFIDVDRTDATLLGGGSAEFAAGGEGIGFGGGGSRKILFTITSRGCLSAGACAQVITTHRSVW